MMKKIFSPPLIPATIFVLVCLSMVIADKVSPSVVGGHVDNTPGRATFILLLATPLFYLLFALINAVDSLICRLTPRLPWLSASLVTIGLAVILTKILFRPEIDRSEHFFFLAGASLLAAALIVIPMSFWKRKIGDKGKADPSSSCDSQPCGFRTHER
jgi:hypothetical protein